jgi:hypothetical protein
LTAKQARKKAANQRKMEATNTKAYLSKRERERTLPRTRKRKSKHMDKSKVNSHTAKCPC